LQNTFNILTNTFYIKFSDSNKKLNPENGIPIGLLSELLDNLEKLIKEDTSSTYLKEVKNESYGILLYSTSVERHNKIKSLHQKLEPNNLKILPHSEIENIAPYAKTVKKVLKLYDDVVLEIYPDNDKRLGLTIDNIVLSNDKKYKYSTITTVTGYLTLIGGKTMQEKPHIRIDGYDKAIYLSKEAEKVLKTHHKENRVQCQIREKYATDGKVKCELLKYKIMPNSENIIDSLSKLSDNDLDFIKDFNPISS